MLESGLENNDQSAIKVSLGSLLSSLFAKTGSSCLLMVMKE
jgi:hypothetical protein